jgi:hypothetical protein
MFACRVALYPVFLHHKYLLFHKNGDKKSPKNSALFSGAVRVPGMPCPMTSAGGADQSKNTELGIDLPANGKMENRLQKDPPQTVRGDEHCMGIHGRSILISGVWPSPDFGRYLWQ